MAKDKTKQCIECNSSFQYKRKEQKLCSPDCAAKHVSKRNREIRACKKCEEKFEVTKSDPKKYCSHSCSASINNQGINRYGKVTIDGEEVRASVPSKVLFCQRKSCGKEISGKTTLKFCSNECSSKHRRETIVEKWLLGEYDGSVKSGLSRAIEIYLKEQAGWRCQSPTCLVPGGWSAINPVTGKVPVEVDHIDGNCYNNKAENLIVLCPSCHAITPTYKALNKNSGRTYRSKYKQFE